MLKCNVECFAKYFLHTFSFVSLLSDLLSPYPIDSLSAWSAITGKCNGSLPGYAFDNILVVYWFNVTVSQSGENSDSRTMFASVRVFVTSLFVFAETTDQITTFK